jgi:hypothetical protein
MKQADRERDKERERGRGGERGEREGLGLVGEDDALEPQL